jgi:hypothetical protein
MELINNNELARTQKWAVAVLNMNRKRMNIRCCAFKLTQNFGGKLALGSTPYIILANQSTFNPCVLENIKNKFNALWGDWGQK